MTGPNGAAQPKLSYEDMGLEPPDPVATAIAQTVIEGVPTNVREWCRTPTTAIKKASYTHKAMIDIIIANPGVNQGELAKYFGFTQGWVSQIMASDAFKQALEQRKAQIVDPAIIANIEERFEALVNRSMDVLMKKLETDTVSSDVALKAMELGARAMGYGAKTQGPLVQNNYVAIVPPKAANPVEWLKAKGLSAEPIIEHHDVVPSGE